MKKLLAVALSAVLPLLASAQGGPPAARGPGAMRLFDPATVETVSGTVVAVTRVDRGQGHLGVHLLLATPVGEIPVHLGPDFYVDAQPVTLGKGDAVRVTGSRVTLDGRPVLLAVTVTRGTDVLTLRDASGRPAWGGAGGGRGRP